MNIEDLGLNSEIKKFISQNDLSEFTIGRVISEHKERYVVKTEEGEIEAEITGNLRFTANGREDFPAVGDWVAMMSFDDGLGIIQKILPRISVLKRQAVGQFGEIQIIATNIDYAFLVQAIDRDFNINRLERYLSICYSSNVEPVIVLTKIDLADQARIAEILESIEKRINDVPVFPISSETGAGLDELKKHIQKGKTYCLLGSSGVGKSTLLNKLSGRQRMKTDSISQSTGKGRHVTSHRELIILDDGGIIIDNPGMRQVGVADSSSGIEKTFKSIISLAENCKFKDCSHTNEPGCAVLTALENGIIEESDYKNFMKMEKEEEYFKSTLAERRKKDKDFGKMVKNFKKDIKKIKGNRRI